MNHDDDYNEGLKYPLGGWIHECDPITVARSKEFVTSKAFAARLISEIIDQSGRPLGSGIHFSSRIFIISQQDLLLPFHQIVDYYIKPLKLYRLKFGSLSVHLEYVKSGLQVEIYLHE